MSAVGAVLAGRVLAESLMVDTCTLKHPTGTTEDANGVVTRTYAAPYYTGPCKVQVRDVDAATPEAGDRAWAVLKLRLDLPMAVTGMATDDVATVTASLLDPDLVGRAFRVVSPFHGSFKTARRVPVEETVA